MTTRRPRVPWLRMGAELLAIVFGVLLALVLDDWRQTQDDNEVRDAIVVSLRAELERNQRVLEERLPYHEAMVDTFRNRMAVLREDPSGPVRLPALARMGFEYGVGAGTWLASGAWEAARASGVLPGVGVDQLFLLSSVYTNQTRAEEALARLKGTHQAYVLASLDQEDAPRALIAITVGLEDLVESELALCGQYHTLARRLADRVPESLGRCGSGHVAIR